jgi:TP901 family phage tail tape measure protein
MAISINDFRVAIRIDNSEAKAKFDETREQIAKVREEMQKLEADGKKDSAAYKELEKQQDKLNKSLYATRKEAGLTSLSYNELRKGARSLKAQMDSAIPGTEKWKALRADYMLTKQRMKELEVQARDTKFSLSKMADGFNKYAAIGASAIASLTGVAMTARKCVDEFAEMQEAESQVRKYTGMTAEEVKGLNEEFKQMDTRTPREKLNALAGDAGRLGITAKKDVLEFVDAADKINVALGEDLGEDAVKNIGKLAQMFGEDEKLGLRGAMLATGSAINEVAQNSSAAEAYLVGFTARVAGAANQAKVAQGDILGYASVLDQNMQQQEMAATAFQTLMMKMFQTPEKFAKIAGQSVEEFTSLIKKDANEAMLQFLDTLNKKGGLDQLAPMFKEMGLDGVRASGVISTMAGKIDDIRDAQKLANDAYRDGTSIINEFNVQNNTVQAGLDKAKKNFKDVRVELGEKLQPVMKYMITTGSLTVKGLSALVSILYEYKGAILTAGTAVAAYTVYVKAGTIATAAYNTITKAATVATNLFNKATKASPWGLVAAGVVAVISYFAIFRDKTDDATDAQKRLNDALEKTKATMDLIAGVKVSAENFEFLTDKQKQQLKSDAQRGIDELDDLLTKGMIETKAWYEQEKESILKATEDNEILRNSYLRGLEKDFDARVAQLAEYVEKKKELEKIVAMVPNPVDTNVPPTDDKALEKELKAKETALQQHHQEQQNILKEGLLNEKLTQDEYQQELYKAEAIYLLSRKALLEEYGKDTSQIQGQIYDKMIAEANRLYQSTQAVNKNTQSDILAQQEGDYQEQVQDIKRAYLEGNIKTEADYQERLKEQERQYLEERRDMLAAYGEDTSSIDNKLLDMDINDKKEGKAKQRESGYKKIDNTSDFEQKNNILQAMYDADLITYQEYEEEKTRINEEHEQLREEQAKATLDVIGQAAAAASQVVSALQDAEISKVTRKYDKEIKAAKKAGKDTTKLEEEKEEAINQVKKKYADKQFAASVLQVTATTAVAAMEAYKAMAGIPIVGPALGTVAAAAAIASGAAQIAVAKQQRDEAKGLKEGGYSDEYVQGYTKNGNPDDVAGVIPVHKNEFVANHESVANPHVRQFLDVFDVAQKNGTIRMINTTQILEQVRTRSGKYAGGFVDTGDSSGSSFAASDISSSGLTPEQWKQLVELMKENNRLLQVVCNKELIVDARKVRDSIKRVEQLEKNVSR